MTVLIIFVQVYVCTYCKFTQIFYTGVIPTLFELALRVLISNINGKDFHYSRIKCVYICHHLLLALEEVKGVPYRIMEPVLAR